jgi:hypothetical protein
LVERDDWLPVTFKRRSQNPSVKKRPDSPVAPE